MRPQLHSLRLAPPTAAALHRCSHGRINGHTSAAAPSVGAAWRAQRVSVGNPQVQRRRLQRSPGQLCSPSIRPSCIPSHQAQCACGSVETHMRGFKTPALPGSWREKLAAARQNMYGSDAHL